MKIIRLKTITKDNATGITGMLTHLQVGASGAVRLYCFQPKGLNPETGQPVASYWAQPTRFNPKPAEMMEVFLPTEVLGTEVVDMASGFNGTAINLTLHINGCIHVEIQPRGRVGKTGAAIESCDFDIRRLEGKAIPKMTVDEIAEDERQKPSPAATPSCNPRMPAN